MELGRLGVWTAMDGMTAAAGAAFAKRVEAWGYRALWLPESRGRNALVHSAWLLANTDTLIVATGIANVYARDPMAMANGQRGLAEQSGGRFLLGLGVSHRPMVEGLRGHPYGKPVPTMRAYLRAMRDTPYPAPPPPEPPLTILAALGPRMMALAAEMADGAHPYNTTPEHTAEARRILGPGKLLCPEVWVLLETDPAEGARRRPRRVVALSAARELRQCLASPGFWRRRSGWRRVEPVSRRDRRLGRRSRDPRAPPAALGRRRRPCLHPTDRPAGFAASRRRPPARAPGAGPPILTGSGAGPTFVGDGGRSARRPIQRID